MNKLEFHILVLSYLNAVCVVFWHPAKAVECWIFSLLKYLVVQFCCYSFDTVLYWVWFVAVDFDEVEWRNLLAQLPASAVGRPFLDLSTHACPGVVDSYLRVFSVPDFQCIGFLLDSYVAVLMCSRSLSLLLSSHAQDIWGSESMGSRRALFFYLALDTSL